MSIDVAIYDHGSIFQFDPLDQAAQDWFDQNVQSEPWQWLGGRLCVDHRFADCLAMGLQDAGFVVAAC